LVSSSLAVLLGNALLALTMAYEAQTPIPIAIAANTLRMVEPSGTPVSALASRSGISSQTARPQGTTLISRRLAFLATSPSVRGKYLRLTPAGDRRQAEHHRLTRDIEATPGLSRGRS
jgi:hypothetical protein